MAYLVDTNCLLRYAQPQHVLNALVHAAFRWAFPVYRSTMRGWWR